MVYHKFVDVPRTDATGEAEKFVLRTTELPAHHQLSTAVSTHSNNGVEGSSKLLEELEYSACIHIGFERSIDGM